MRAETVFCLRLPSTISRHFCKNVDPRLIEQDDVITSEYCLSYEGTLKMDLAWGTEMVCPGPGHNMTSYSRLQTNVLATFLGTTCIRAAHWADHQWNAEWADSPTTSDSAFSSRHPPPGLTLPRTAWVRLNRLRTGVGRFFSCLYKWGMASSAAREYGQEEQTVDIVVLKGPTNRPPHGLHGLTVLDRDAGMGVHYGELPPLPFEWGGATGYRCPYSSGRQPPGRDPVPVRERIVTGPHTFPDL